MKIKSLSLTFLLIIITSFSHAQISFEAELGGSNYMGLSLNTSFDISLSKNKNHVLVPTIGVGILSPGIYDPTTIIHTGITYKYKRWGLGTEVSGFTPNPFFSSSYYNDFVDMLVYPNANYTFKFKSNWYCKVSTGAYFAYSKFYSGEGKFKMNFEGDIIPGAGVSVGYKF